MPRTADDYSAYELDYATVGGQTLAAFVQSLNSSTSISGTSTVTPSSSGGTLATTASPLNQILGRQIYIEDFGGVGDCTVSGTTASGTDNGPALQAAINALGSRGGIIRFQAKNYRILTGVTVTQAPIHFQGAGAFEGNSINQGTVLTIDQTVAPGGTTVNVTTTADNPISNLFTMNVPSTSGLAPGMACTVYNPVGGLIPNALAGFATIVTVVSATQLIMSEPMTYDIPSGSTLTFYTPLLPFLVGFSLDGHANDTYSSKNGGPGLYTFGTRWSDLSVYQVHPTPAAGITTTSSATTASPIGTTINVASTAGMAAGMLILSAGGQITPGTTIASVVSTTQLTLSAPTVSAFTTTAISLTIYGGSNTWTPTAYPPVFNIWNTAGGFELDRVFFLGIYIGIYAKSCGHFKIPKISGQFYLHGLWIENCQDSPYVNYLRHWTYQDTNVNRLAFQTTYLDVLFLGRSDGGDIGELFAYAARSAVHAYQEPTFSTGSGTANVYGSNPALYRPGGSGNGTINLISTDHSKSTLWIGNFDGTPVLPEASLQQLWQIANYSGNCLIPGPGANVFPDGVVLPINMVTGAAAVQIANFYAYYCLGSACVITGNSNYVDIKTAITDVCNYGRSGAPIISVGDSGGVGYINKATVGSYYTLNASGAPILGAALNASGTAGNGQFNTPPGFNDSHGLVQLFPLLTALANIIVNPSAGAGTVLQTIQGATTGTQLRFAPNTGAGGYNAAAQAGDFTIVPDVAGAINTGGLVIGHSNLGYEWRQDNVTGNHLIGGATPHIRGKIGITLDAPTINLNANEYLGMGGASGINVSTVQVALNEPISEITVAPASNAGAVLPVIPINSASTFYECVTINSGANPVALTPPNGTTLSTGASSFALQPGTAVTWVQKNNVWMPTGVASTTGALPSGSGTSTGSSPETVYQYNGTSTGAISSTTGSTVAASAMPQNTAMWLTSSSANTVSATGVGPQFFTDGSALRWLSNGALIA